MADKIFEEPRLVSIYDHFDGERADLDAYVSVAKELKAKSILDVGCGTGSLACRLAEEGFKVVGIDPAQASLDFARSKPNAEKVRWILGDATALPAMTVDLAMMTGNVAQVFLTDETLEATLKGIHNSVVPNGHLVFEVRDPSKKAWLEWNHKNTFRRLNVPVIGFVESWCEVLSASKDLVSFRWTYIFKSDGQKVTSDSTLRFRTREEIEFLLDKSGYKVKEVRDAPDRPGKEFVFIAVAK